MPINAMPKTRVRVETDGTVSGTKIINIETGQPIISLDVVDYIDTEITTAICSDVLTLTLSQPIDDSLEIHRYGIDPKMLKLIDDYESKMKRFTELYNPPGNNCVSG